MLLPFLSRSSGQRWSGNEWSEAGSVVDEETSLPLIDTEGVDRSVRPTRAASVESAGTRVAGRCAGRSR